MSTYQRSSVPIVVLSCRNEHSGLLLWLRQQTSKSFYAYVRSMQNVRDKGGPLEDKAGNIITQGLLMAEELNMHFSSVFTTDYTSSLPVQETKFNGTDGGMLGQLVVTPEVVANKINNIIKDIKTLGHLESWRKALEERGMWVSRPKTQFIDFSFEQNAQGNRTQVKILFLVRKLNGSLTSSIWGRA